MSNKVLATSRAARTSIEVDGSQSLPVGVVRTLKKPFSFASWNKEPFFRTDLYGLDSEEVSNARNIFDEQSKRVLIGMRKSDTSFS